MCLKPTGHVVDGGPIGCVCRLVISAVVAIRPGFGLALRFGRNDDGSCRPSARSQLGFKTRSKPFLCQGPSLLGRTAHLSSSQ